MRRYDDALSVANQMLTLDPDSRSGYDMLAAVYEQMSDEDQAAETYARIVSLEPEDAKVWEHLGTWRSLQERNDDAIDAYARAIEIYLQPVTARFSLAESYLEVIATMKRSLSIRGLLRVVRVACYRAMISPLPTLVLPKPTMHWG